MNEVKRCTECGRRFDRPGHTLCNNKKHPQPDVAQRIVREIEENLRDRCGVWPDDIDEETEGEIRDTLAKIVRKEMKARK